MDQRKLNPELLKDTPSFMQTYKRVSFFLFITSTLFNVWLRHHYEFSTLTYKNSPRSFTIVDYGFILFLLIIGILYVLQKRTHLYHYYKQMIVALNIFLLLYTLLGYYPSISYICYSWHFPLHDYLIPPVMPIDNQISMLSSGFQYLGLCLYLNANNVSYKRLEKKGIFLKKHFVSIIMRQNTFFICIQPLKKQGSRNQISISRALF